jgi:transcriptional regulator GlxA family with amidase domain
MARLQAARRLLEQSANQIGEVAERSGFGTADRLRGVFGRKLRASPVAYRERFAGLATSRAPEA